MSNSRWIKNWFANTAPLEKPLVRDGICYKTVENYYAAVKTLDQKEQRKIAQMEPYAAKTYTRKVSLRPDWEQVKLAVMYEALCHKFAPGTQWHKELMATKGQEIIEWNNWRDTRWGVPAQLGPKGEAIPSGEHGDNLLGRILMFIRDSQDTPPADGMLEAKQRWLLQNLPPAPDLSKYKGQVIDNTTLPTLRATPQQSVEQTPSSPQTPTATEKVLTISFTGHRPQKFRNQAEQEKAKQVLAQMIERATNRAVELGYSKIRYISGTAPGIDTYAADLCLKQSQSRQDIQVELVAAVPCKTFPSVWPASHKQDYEAIIGSAHQVHYVSDRPYSNPSHLHKRNEWMVNQLTGSDDLVLAVHNGSVGGTQRCIDYALRQGKAIVVYNPQTEKFFRLGNWPTDPAPATAKQPSRKQIDHER